MSYKEYTVRIFESGIKAWYVNGKLHREDGPALEGVIGNEWYVNGDLHREYGPAIEWFTGYKEWHINGQKMTEQEFHSRKQANSCDGKIVEIDGVKYKLKALR
jgi:hypothetical protein